MELKVFIKDLKTPFPAFSQGGRSHHFPLGGNQKGGKMKKNGIFELIVL